MEFREFPLYGTPLAKVLELQRHRKEYERFSIPVPIKNCSEAILADLKNENPLKLCNLKSSKLKFG